MKKLLKILPMVMLMCIALTSVFAVAVPQFAPSLDMTSSVVDSTEMALAAAGKVYTVSLVICVIFVIANWKIFAKAGEPGWASIIPIYANVVQFKMVGLNPWLLLLYLVPLVNVVVAVVFAIVVPFRLAKSFGKDLGWGFGLWLLPYIFNLILAFGSSEYVGPNGQPKV